VIYRLDKALVRSDPFPHLVTKQMLEPAAFEALRREFPPTDIFEANRRHAFRDGRASRINLGRGDPLFDEFLSTSPAWRAFVDETNSPAFITRVYELFGEALESHGSRLAAKPYEFHGHVERPPTNLVYKACSKFHLVEAFDRFRAALDGNKLCVEFDIAWARNGYSTEAHVDNRNKLAAFVLYFGNIGGSGGDFQVLKLKQPTPLSQCTRYPTDGELEVVNTLKPQPNLGVLFLNCNNAYHAVTPLDGSDRPREFIYVSIASRYTAPIW